MSRNRTMDFLTDLVTSGRISVDDYEKALFLEKRKEAKQNAAGACDAAKAVPSAPKYITSNNTQARGSNLFDAELDAPRVRYAGIYDCRNPKGIPFRTLPEAHHPLDPAVRTADSPPVSPKSDTSDNGLLASVSRMSLGESGKGKTTGQEPLANTKKGGLANTKKGGLANTKKGGGVTTKGAPAYSKKGSGQPKGQPNTAQKGGAQRKDRMNSAQRDDAPQPLGLRIDTKGSADDTGLQLPANISKKGPIVQGPTITTKNPETQAQRQAGSIQRNIELQENRLSKLGLTSDEALRFACPWDLYLRRDNKKCTDVSCPFNHSGAGNLDHKPLMCPFWGGKAGRHARCTKPANVCRLAHYECGHKQYGALPPGWVIRN